MLWNPISKKTQENLCIPVAEEEMHSALKSFSNNKSPGPDGFTMKILKVAWNFIKANILEIFKDFHKQSCEQHLYCPYCKEGEMLYDIRLQAY